MVIRAEDRISKVLAQDEALVDVFTRFSPHFEKLRNPSLRRLLGRLVTVRDAAGVAGVDLAALLNALNGEPDEDPGQSLPPEPAMDNVTTPPNPQPEFLRSIDPARIVELDVREELRAGREPFALIMAAVRDVTEDKVLRLRATFEPVPLYHVLEKRGFAYWTECLEADDWVVWFFAAESAAGGGEVNGAGDGAAQPSSGASEIITLDVRGLEPPEPMMRTLEALDAMSSGGTLIQTNVRVPRFLIEELNRRGYPSESREVAAGVVELTIRKP